MGIPQFTTVDKETDLVEQGDVLLDRTGGTDSPIRQFRNNIGQVEVFG